MPDRRYADNFKIGNEYIDLRDGVSRAAIEEINGDIESLQAQDNLHSQQITQNLALINANTLAIGNIQYPFIAGKNMVFIGDSWTNGTGADTPSNRFSTLLAGKMGMTEINFGTGGAGWARPGNNFRQQLTYADANLTTEQKEDTMVVLIYGGINDANHWYDEALSDALYRTAVAQTIYQACQVFPNAVIYVAMPNTHLYIFTHLEFNANTWAYMNYVLPETLSRRVVCLNNICNVISGYPDFYASDYSHPSNRGHKVLAGYIGNCMMGGSPDITYWMSNIVLKDDPGFSWRSYETGYIYRQNYDVIFTGGYLEFGDTLTIDTEYYFADLNNVCAAPSIITAVPLIRSEYQVGQLSFGTGGKVYVKLSYACDGAMASPGFWRFGHHDPGLIP